MALLSPSHGFTIDYCSLQAGGCIVGMSGWEWQCYAEGALGGMCEIASMHEVDKMRSML